MNILHVEKKNSLVLNELTLKEEITAETMYALVRLTEGAKSRAKHSKTWFHCVVSRDLVVRIRVGIKSMYSRLSENYLKEKGTKKTTTENMNGGDLCISTREAFKRLELV